jgi:outer membrane immunogenic protein
MNKFVLGAVGLLALAAAPAGAADLPARVYSPPPMPPAIYNWSGFYIGINGGGGSSQKCWDLVALPGAVLSPTVSEGCHNATGGTVGGQIGYRWQAANWVFGVEAQGNWADFTGNNLNSLTGSSFAVSGLTDESKIDAFGLFTGQIGYAWNNVLWYFKGGGAVVGDKYRTFVVGSNIFVDSASETRWGGSLGTGVEIGFAPNWSVGVEYNHLFLGSRNINAVTPFGAFSATDHIRQDADIGTVRVNYTFGGPAVGRY